MPFPEHIRERAKYLMLDAIGIAYASQGFPFAGATMAAMTSLGTGESAVIGYGRKLNPRDAALVNGVLAHGLDYDDTHSPGVIHATVSSLPLALALGDKLKVSGRDFLTAYVAAMETSTRLGSVAKGGFHQVGFHPTGLDRHIRLHACRFAASRAEPRTGRDGARCRAVHGGRQPRIPGGRRLDKTYASGLGGVERDYRRDAGEARLCRAARGV